MQTAVTTVTCILEYLSWDFSYAEKTALTQLYVPYLVLGKRWTIRGSAAMLTRYRTAALMGFDMVGRLNHRLLQTRSTLGQKNE